MNKVQRAIIVIVVIVMAAMLIYPPFHAQWKNGGIVYMGYHYIFTDNPFFKGPLKPEVTLSRLFLQWIVVLIVGIIACYMAEDKKD
jgi:hypothetical protein